MSDLGLRIVEVEHAPCQHHHASNYDSTKVVKGVPIQVLANGQMWCFDCEEFFTPQIPQQRYTLEQIEALSEQWATENEATNDARWIVSNLLAWLARREREGRDGA